VPFATCCDPVMFVQQIKVVLGTSAVVFGDLAKSAWSCWLSVLVVCGVDNRSLGVTASM
jgi:hypothetical protein